VLLGWGSFGHVLESADRLELLRACDRVTPEGPILLSIFEPVGTSVGKRAFYVPWGGFLVQPGVEELEQHARALGRRLIASIPSPTHATLVRETR